MKKNLFLIAISLMLIFLGACSNNTGSENTSTNGNDTISKENNDETPKKGGELRVALGTNLSNLDPIQGSAGHDHIFLYNIFDTLIEWNNKLEMEPGLAESWEIPDEKTIILHLREGVTFHDGTPFNAEAVKVNLDRANSEYSKISDLINIESTEVVDNYTIKLNLKKPDSSILMALSDRGGMMISPEVLKSENLDEFKPIGTGPFKFESWVPNGDLVLIANKNYWREGLPYLDKMTITPMTDENTRINSLVSGQIDIAFPIYTNNVTHLQKNEKIQLVTEKQIQSWQVYLNIAKPPLDNKKVRQALLYAIDREAMNNAIFFGLGEVAHQHFPEGYWAHNPEVRFEYDPEKAKKLIEESGLDNIEIDVVFKAEAAYEKIVEVLQAQLGEVGIKVNLHPMELTKGVTEFFSEKRYNAGMWPWTGRPDPQMTLQALWGESGYYNAGNTNSPKLKEAIDKSAATYEQSEREKIIRETVKIALEEEAMNIPLIFEPATAALSPKVKGFEGNLAGKPKIAFVWLDE